MLEGNSWGIGVDDVHGFMYWNDNGHIKQATLNGSNTKIIIEAGKLNVTYLTFTYVLFLFRVRLFVSFVIVQALPYVTVIYLRKT